MKSLPKPNKQDVQQFWGEVYDVAYTDVDKDLTGDSLRDLLAELEDMFRLREQLPVVEIALQELAGKRVLEIGSGAGSHSALFATYGAIVTSLDITAERARSTRAKFNLLGEAARDCRALQADAESLPFADGVFDIVYSNGVLHHSPDTDRAIAEAFRVLKPGGQAAIMLYCKSSWDYWFNQFFCVGIIKGKILTSPNWLGHSTEWIGNSKQTVTNPVTRCYTGRALKKMFGSFEQLSLRKTEFYFYLIPFFGRYYRRFQIRRYGVHRGGILAYGEPWPKKSALEYRLGKIMGWAWNISAYKPKI